MGLFEKIFKPKEYQQALKDAKGTFEMLTAYRPVFTSWNGAIYESELVRGAIDARARHISKLKVELTGNAQPKLKTRMQFQPNPYMTYSQWLYRISTVLDCTNTCFLVPMLDDNTLEPIGYYPVLPQRASVIDYGGEAWLKYEFYNGKVGAIELSKCAVLTKYQYKSDFFGESQDALKDTMRVIHLQNDAIKEAVKNSSTFRFMAKLNNFTNGKDGLKKERDRFTRENLHEGSGLLLFPNIYDDIKQIDSKPFTVDNAQMNYIRENVNRYFGVNAEIMDNSASVDKMDAFFNGCVEPFSIALSQALTKAIYTQTEQAFGSKVVVNANRLQYMNTASKVQLAKELGDRGAMTINEIRELFNYEPIPDGDTAFIRGEYYTVQNKLTDTQETEGEENGTENN